MIKIKFILLFTILVATLFIMVGCNSDNKIIKTIPSPNGDYVATVFIRDLGATTKESYQLSVMKEGKKVNTFTTGNVFVSYDPFNVEWTEDKEITVKSCLYSNTFTQKESIYDITIKYEAVSEVEKYE